MTDYPDQLRSEIDLIATRDCRESIVEDSRNLLRFCKQFRRDSLKAQLGWTNLPDSVIQFVFKNCENPINSVRYICVDLLIEAVEFHVDNCDMKGAECEWLRMIGAQISSLPFHLKVKYSFFSVLLRNVSFTFTKTLVSPVAIMEWFRDRSLVASLTELFCSYLNKAAFEGTDMVRQSLTTVLVALQEQNAAEAEYISRNLIPGILKYCSNEAVDILMEELLLSVSGNDSKVSLLRALLQCLSCTFPARLLRTPMISLSQVIGDKLLLECLFHPDLDVRISAFRLLCDHPKSTTVMAAESLRLCRWFLVLSLNTPSSAFRQSLIATIRRLFGRLRDSGNQIVKLYLEQEWCSEVEGSHSDKKICNELATSQVHVCCTDKKFHPELDAYQAFLKWIHSTAFQCLTFGSNNARVSSGLSIIRAFYDTFASDPGGTEKILWVSQSDVDQLIDTKSVMLLVWILTDSYEENQLEALKLLSSFPKEVMQTLMDSDTLQVLAKWALTGVSSTKPQTTEAAAVVFLFLCNCRGVLLNEVILNYDSLLSVLMTTVENHIDAVRRDLFAVARDTPIFGVLHCIGVLLKHTVESSSHTALHLLEEQGGKTLSRLIDIALAAGAVVGPVINSSSPEGHLPMDIAHINGSDVSNGDVTAVGFAECQSLLVSCWRTQREISAIFATIASILVETKECDQYLDLILRMSENFLTQLSECKHRGAFETTYAAFVDFCTALWRCPSVAVKKLPEDWLRKVLSDIRDDQMSLCATRRSAGLPFLVEAIVSTEPLGNGSLNFQLCMETLTEMAMSTRADVIEPKIHSFNILRAVYRVSRLAKLVIPYVSDGVKAAILGFSHPHWSVRNSATLLFGALVTRIFGVPRVKDGSDKKTSMAVGEFDSTYSGLLPFLLSQLHDYLREDKVETREFSLFPVLLLLTRLRPIYLKEDRIDSDSDLACFVPAVLRIAISAAVLKIRSLAARALVSIVPQSEQTQLLTTLINSFHDRLSQKSQHGILLILGAVLEDRCVAEDFLRNHSHFASLKVLVSSCGKSHCAVTVSCAAKVICVMAKFLETTEFLDEVNQRISHGKWTDSWIKCYAYAPVAKAGLLSSSDCSNRLWEKAVSYHDDSLGQSILSELLSLDKCQTELVVNRMFLLSNKFATLVNMMAATRDEKLIRKLCKVIRRIYSDGLMTTVDQSLVKCLNLKLSLVLQEKTKAKLVDCLLQATVKDLSLFTVCKTTIMEHLSVFAEPKSSTRVRMVAVSLLDCLLCNTNVVLLDFIVPVMNLLLDEEPDIRYESAKLSSSGNRTLESFRSSPVLCPQLSLDVWLQTCMLMPASAPLLMKALIFIADTTDGYFDMDSRRNSSVNGGIFEKNELNIYAELPVVADLVGFYVRLATGGASGIGPVDHLPIAPEGFYVPTQLWSYWKAVGTGPNLFCHLLNGVRPLVAADRLDPQVVEDLLRHCCQRLDVLMDYLLNIMEDPLITQLEDSLELLCLRVYWTTVLSAVRLALKAEIPCGEVLCESLAKLKRLRLEKKKLDNCDDWMEDCCEVLEGFFAATYHLSMGV